MDCCLDTACHSFLDVREIGASASFSSSIYPYSLAVDSTGSQWVCGYFSGEYALGDKTISNAGNHREKKKKKKWYTLLAVFCFLFPVHSYGFTTLQVIVSSFAFIIS